MFFVMLPLYLIMSRLFKKKDIESNLSISGSHSQRSTVSPSLGMPLVMVIWPAYFVEYMRENRPRIHEWEIQCHAY